MESELVLNAVKRFSWLDAHMILTTTVSVLAYAARMEVLLNGNNTAAP